MATLTGPMFSLTAKGALAKALCFRTVRGRPTASRWLAPPNPRSNAQISIRHYNRWLARFWHEVPPTNQTTWQPPAAAAGFAPYHAYLSTNMSRWQSQLAPTQVAGAPPSFPTLAIFFFSGTVQPDKSIYLLAIFSGGLPWRALFFETPTPAAPPSRNNFLSQSSDNSFGVAGYTVPPRTPGSYYFWVWGGSSTGDKTNTLGPITVNVT
jgi:hypothetical protein